MFGKNKDKSRSCLVKNDYKMAHSAKNFRKWPSKTTQIPFLLHFCWKNTVVVVRENKRNGENSETRRTLIEVLHGMPYLGDPWSHN